MSDFEEKLNAILSDPNAMAQVMQLAQSLNLDGPPPGGSSGNGETTASSEEKPPGANPLSGISDLFGEIDPGMTSGSCP